MKPDEDNVIDMVEPEPPIEVTQTDEPRGDHYHPLWFYYTMIWVMLIVCNWLDLITWRWEVVIFFPIWGILAALIISFAFIIAMIVIVIAIILIIAIITLVIMIPVLGIEFLVNKIWTLWLKFKDRKNK